MILFAVATAYLVGATLGLHLLARLPKRQQARWIPGLTLVTWILAVGVFWARGEIFVPLTCAAVLMAGAAIAWIMGRTLSGPGMLLGVAVGAAAFDLYSFFFGSTGRLLEIGGEKLAFLTLTWPTAEGLRPIVGLGDLVFLGAAAHHLPRGAGAVLPLLGLETALVLALVLGRPLPGLPFLALALGLAVALESRGEPGQKLETGGGAQLSAFI